MIDVTDEERRIVEGVLRAHLPCGATVSVFGSRANHKARRFSDLDLAIDAGRPLSLDETASLRGAFSESDLNWTVDVVDWWGVGAAFQAVIAANRVPFVVVETDHHEVMVGAAGFEPTTPSPPD